MAAHDIVPVSEILAEIQGVRSTLEDRIRWQVVRARNADLIEPDRAHRAEQCIVDATAQLWMASRLLLEEVNKQRRSAEYREACDRG